MYIEMFLSANRSVLEEHLGFLQVDMSLECIHHLTYHFLVCRRCMWNSMNLME